MKFIQKIKESPHYERLKNSDQYRFDKRQFLVMAALSAGYILIAVLGATSGIKGDISVGISFFFSLIFLGATLYFGFRWLEIFLYMEHYTFCQVKMEKLHLLGRGIACFSVEFTDRRGKLQSRNTSNMFSSYRKPYVEDYNNKMALIGYNEKTDRLVVIGLAQGNIH